MSSSGQAEEHFCAAVLDTSFHYGAGRRSSGPSGLKWRCSKPVTLSYTTQINIIISKRSIRNAIFQSVQRDETCHITVLFEDTASVLSLCQNKSYKLIHFVLCGLFSLSNNYKDTFSTRQRFRIESQCLWIRNPSCQLVDMHLVATSQSTAEWLTHWNHPLLHHHPAAADCGNHRKIPSWDSATRLIICGWCKPPFCLLQCTRGGEMGKMQRASWIMGTEKHSNYRISLVRGLAQWNCSRSHAIKCYANTWLLPPRKNKTDSGLFVSSH